VTSITLPAPAKINHFLHICGRRDDGYHNLQTLFQFLDYSDELTFTPRNDSNIHISPPIENLAVQDNLIYKAAKALQQATNCTLGADIHLLKRLPMGGGIGGGSSNAATALLGLNALWQLKLPLAQLQEIGAKLGADIPIFIHGHTAWAEGIGDKLSNVEMPEKWYVVLTPATHVSTATIFSHKDLTRDSQAITLAAFLEQGGRNDCQELVKKLHPEVEIALDFLNNHAPSRMTGTGACVFASFEDKTKAEEVLRDLPDSMTGFIARSVNESPLHKSLKKAGQRCLTW
jgi:4-diphosphocytidyl-2-C-methyl-D-erythritol kinase